MDRKLQIKPKIRIDAGFCIYMSLLLLLLPVQWVAALWLSMLVHECSHAVALLIMRKSIYEIRLQAYGCKIITTTFTPFQEFVCALAGPLGGLLPLLLARWLPAVAFCAVIHSLYNLLPMAQADGSRILHGFLAIILKPQTARRISTFTEKGMGGMLLIVAVYIAIRWAMWMLPLLVGGILLLGGRNYSCKQRQVKVQ